MSNCPDCDKSATATATSTSTTVADFTVTGFSEAHHAPAKIAALENVHALKLSACVGASYNQTTNKICFHIPVYGDFCITSPLAIPVGGDLKACAETCGSFIPTGLKVTVYLNGNAIWSGVVWGRC